jgi:CheY-like chemotaxis protein
MVIGLRLIALLSREEMEKRLRESEVGCDDYVVEKLFPALLRHAGEELYANGVAMMLLLAINDSFSDAFMIRDMVLDSYSSGLISAMVPEERVAEVTEIIDQCRKSVSG